MRAVGKQGEPHKLSPVSSQNIRQKRACYYKDVRKLTKLFFLSTIVPQCIRCSRVDCL